MSSQITSAGSPKKAYRFVASLPMVTSVNETARTEALMDRVVLFKFVQFALIVVFSVFVSDVRRKEHMVPFGNRWTVTLLKFVYLIPLGIYGWCLVRLDEVGLQDAMALLLTGLGTLAVVKAKHDLGKHHTWTGYRLEGARMVTRGIYAYVRHPLYLGIFVFIAGGVCTSLLRVSWPFFIAGLATLVYIVSFLTLAARREARHLAVAHADDYQQYERQVRAFLPIRKTRKAA